MSKIYDNQRILTNMIYAIRGDILQAYKNYVASIKTMDAKLNTSADGWKFARKSKKSK